MDLDEIERRFKLLELKEREVALKERELALAKETKKELSSSPRKCIDCKGPTFYYAMEGSNYCSLHKPKSYPKKVTYIEKNSPRNVIGVESISIFDSSIVTPHVERYVYNDHNRRLGRVGKVMGTAVESSDKVKRYADNDHNRRLGRVGKVIGTAVESSKTKVKAHTRGNGTRVKSYYRT